jgi:hypothetical protein
MIHRHFRFGFMATAFYAARSRALLIREVNAGKERPLTDLTP